MKGEPLLHYWAKNPRNKSKLPYLSSYITLYVQPDSLAQLAHTVLHLAPVLALVGLLHGPDDEGPVGVELRLPAGCLNVVEDAWFAPCTLTNSVTTKIFPRNDLVIYLK